MRIALVLVLVLACAASARGGPLEITFATDLRPELGQDLLQKWIDRAVGAVTAFYGRFPVPRAQLAIRIEDCRRPVGPATTYPRSPAVTELSIARTVTPLQLDDDWILVHELVHLGFPNVPAPHRWIEEGLATYVEPLIRVRADLMTPSRMWFEMARDMPQGLPRAGDGGLDGTKSWGRTYWGGALFWLLADIEIRQKTGNTKSVQDALRGILDAGGNIGAWWSMEKALATGDKAVGVDVLVPLWKQHGARPVSVDLAKLWKDLGVIPGPCGARFDDTAPLAAIRRAISGAPESPLAAIATGD